jgi:hypothetical protein
MEKMTDMHEREREREREREKERDCWPSLNGKISVGDHDDAASDTNQKADMKLASILLLPRYSFHSK